MLSLAATLAGRQHTSNINKSDTCVTSHYDHMTTLASDRLASVSAAMSAFVVEHFEKWPQHLRKNGMDFILP
jgi:hypothetical protein